MSIYHDRKQAAGEECLVAPLEGNASGDDIKNRPNDLLVPWLVSKHSVLQFSHYQVLFPQHDKVRTSGRARDSKRKNPQTVETENNDSAK